MTLTPSKQTAIKMQKIFTADNLAIAEHVKTVLENEGIATLLRNQYLGGGIGDLPVMDCLPELWVLNPAHAQRAEDLINSLSEPNSEPDWNCIGCGQLIEAPFGQCWNCGQTRYSD